MAYTTSDKYKNKIYAESSFSDLKIYINNEKIDTDYVMDIQLDDDCFEDESFTLGSATYQKIVLKLGNECLPCTIKEINTFKITYGIELDDGTKEWIPIGEYLLGKEPDTTYSDYTIFTLYDYMSKFDVEYDGSSKVPCTRAELLADICQSVGVELATTTFLGSDRIVGTYDNTITARQYLSFISERAGGFAKIGRDKKLYIKCYADVDVIELSDTESASAVINSYDVLKSITKVFYEDALNKWEFGNDTGIVIQLSDSSPFAITEEEVEAIYNKLNGLSFQSLDVKMWGDPAYDTGDIISVYGYKTFIQKSWKYNNGFYGSYKTILKESKSISKVDKISSSEKIKRLLARLDEETGKIEILTQKTDNNTSNIGSLSIETNEIRASIEKTNENLEENYNRIISDIAKTIIAIQNSGGANLIKNSVMFAYDSDGNPTEWTTSGDGSLSMNSSAEALANGSLSGHIFTLSGKKVTQRVNVKIDNDEDEKTYYTFSTKIKKDITGSCYVRIFNSNEEYKIELNEGESSFYGDYEIKALLPKDSYYDIEFYGSSDSNATFTDNMFAIGEYKTQWTQASGEIMNTQVNINVDGVLVKSSVYDGDYTIMSPLEFAGYSNINGIITKVFTLNKDTTTVKKLESEDEIKMVPIKIVPISTGDLQGWAFVPSTGGGD